MEVIEHHIGISRLLLILCSLSGALNEMETATSMARLDAEDLNKDPQHDVGALNAPAVQVSLAGKECRILLPIDDR